MISLYILLWSTLYVWISLILCVCGGIFPSPILFIKSLFLFIHKFFTLISWMDDNTSLDELSHKSDRFVLGAFLSILLFMLVWLIIVWGGHCSGFWWESFWEVREGFHINAFLWSTIRNTQKDAALQVCSSWCQKHGWHDSTCGSHTILHWFNWAIQTQFTGGSRSIVLCKNSKSYYSAILVIFSDHMIMQTIGSV